MSRTLWCAIAALTLAGGCSDRHGTGANPRVTVYMLDFPGRAMGAHDFHLLPVGVPSAEGPSAAPDQTECALASLFRVPLVQSHGPLGGKQAHFTAVPPGARLLSLAVSDRVVTVNASVALTDVAYVERFYREFTDMRGKCALLALAQIVYTATQQDPTASVQILVEGKRISRLGDSDESIDKPLFRRDLGREVHEKVDKAITGVEGSTFTYVSVDAPAASSAKPGAKPSGGRP